MGERAWESNAEWGGLQAIASGLGKSVPQPQLHVLWDAQLVTATGVTVQTLWETAKSLGHFLDDL